MDTPVAFRFYVTVEEGTDKKTNVHKIKWIQPVDSKQIYELPAELQSPTAHKEIYTLPKLKSILSSMKTRGSYRIFTLSLPPDVASIYMDEEGDVKYKDFYLQPKEAKREDTTTANKESKEQLTTQSRTDIPNTKKNLNKIREDFVLENFDGKNFPIVNWLHMFEKECDRCQITLDENKILILRLFLEGTAKDWYASRVMSLGLDESFNRWRKCMLESFRETGWRKHREAYTFRYIGGSLVDYAMRKENLLVHLRKDFPIDILIDLIITDLPVYVQDRIDRTEVTSIEDMLRELRKLEGLVQRKKTYNYSNISNDETSNQRGARTNEKKPCPYCELKGFPGRFHPETICRQKQRDAYKDQKNIKTVNNIAIQEHLNETLVDQKN